MLLPGFHLIDYDHCDGVCVRRFVRASAVLRRFVELKGHHSHWCSKSVNAAAVDVAENSVFMRCAGRRRLMEFFSYKNWCVAFSHQLPTTCTAVLLISCKFICYMQLYDNISYPIKTLLTPHILNPGKCNGVHSCPTICLYVVLAVVYYL